MADDDARFACPGCGKRYRWKPELAGRKVRCHKCNLKMRAPAAIGDDAEALEPLPSASEDKAEQEVYEPDWINEPIEPSASSSTTSPPDDLPPDFSDDTDQTDAASVSAEDSSADEIQCPSCHAPLKPDAVLCVNCGFNLKTGKRIETQVQAEPNDAGDAEP